VDISRGDMIVKSSDIPSIATDFQVMLGWMGEMPMQIGTDYLIKRASNVIPGQFIQIDHKVDVNSLEKTAGSELQLNEIAQCQLSLKQAIAFDAYTKVKGTGSFIVIDKYTQATLAAGMIIKQVDGEVSAFSAKEYTNFEKDLNALIRQEHPEWGCRSIDDLK